MRIEHRRAVHSGLIILPACVWCGKEVPEEATHCPSCGTRAVKPMKVKFVRDCWTGVGTVRKGMKGTLIAERKGFSSKWEKKPYRRTSI